jgi:hypothetical protein
MGFLNKLAVTLFRKGVSFMKKAHVFSVMPVCLLALISVVGVSCTSFQVSSLEVAQRPSAGTVCGNFDIVVKVDKFLGYSAGPNLFNLTSDVTDPKITDAIKGEITKLGGSKAIDVKIDYKAPIIQILLNVITFGIYAPATAHVTGTVIK